MATDLIGRRIKARREERGLSQEGLAALFGFKDRQTVSAIETGQRRVSADELMLAVEMLGGPLEYYTDPFMLAGEGKFSWRQSGLGSADLQAYERRAGRWIAAFRELAPAENRASPPLSRLSLTRRSSFEEAMAAGESIAAHYRLGAVPAARLAEAMERQLGILVLMVDAYPGISGAACCLPGLDTVLINRNEPAGRRHFDLAHELFHILTWEAMPPAHSETAELYSKDRVEQLANNFSSALLMPAAALDRYGDWHTVAEADLPARLAAAAEELRVTGPALKWRLVNLGRLDRKAGKAIPDAALRAANRDEPPPLFSRLFMEAIGKAIDEGRVSVRRAADLTDLTVDDLAELFAAHGLDCPFDL